MLIVFSEESATISYRLGIGMIPDDEDTRDYDDTDDSSLKPVTDLTGVGGPSNDEEGIPSRTTTDISSMLEQDSNQEVKELNNHCNNLHNFYAHYVSCGMLLQIFNIIIV